MEVKESKVEMVDDSVNKEIGDLPKDVEDKSMPCTSNFEDHSFYNVEDLPEDQCVGGDASSNKEVDEEVDVLECTGFDDNNEVEFSECNDGTDAYSSSFSGTVSEDENETALNDQEADSMICNDTSLPFWVRKKKLTDHWRRFIQPIMWRCKWVELKVREFQKQAEMYDKELQESCQAKQLELENLESEEVGIKALSPLPCHTQKTRLKKRKTRKRVEDASDIQSYALNHNLFSYNEYRKSFADIALNDNSRNLDKKNKSSKEEAVFCEEIPPLEFREGDAFLEQILLKIEAAKLEANNLKNRVDKVVNENPSRFSSVNTLNLLGSADVLTSSEQQKPQLAIKNEDEKPVISEEKPVKSASVSSQQDTQPEDDETGDILLSEIVASRRREGKAVVPDKKLQKTEQTPVEEGPSRPARKRTPRNLDMVVKEETNPKRRKVSREKPKSNGMMASRFKQTNRKRKRGKRRSGSAGLRRRS
ncbi:hypothetical protein EUTSA_v10025086mg [Eutrema salsugineum]|uniref:Uncharacterized protein n=1 Tax=Eutrema salsugineum TaxID=72664 RepID=V4MDP2_EUTSA|nr:uncharacterized protein LOC18030484 [Eutrema salsugineum]ESQ53342.1 hypothetical protein EUTSA_v10025086mg [Eutrema salsugineum]